MTWTRAAWAILAMALVVQACQQSPAPPVDASAAVHKTASQKIGHFVLNDFRNGQTAMSLDSVSALVFDAEQIAEVEKPHLVFYANGIKSSEMTAPSGKVHMVTHEVEAWGGVTVVTPDSTTLTTARLQYDPKKRVVWTQDPVRLEKPDSITEGEGLVTDPELKRVRIGRQRVRLKKGAAKR